jgi:putative transposase
MTNGPSRAVLRPGDGVSFDGGEHQVLALTGTSVRLRAQDGGEQVVLASYLMAGDLPPGGLTHGWSR